MLFNSFDAVRGTLPDKLELMLCEASNVFIKSFFSQKHLCQIRQVSRSNSLCESSQLLGGHLRQRHDQDLEGLVERLADVGERRLIDDTFSIADLHLNSVRAVSYTHLDVYKRQGSKRVTSIFPAHVPWARPRNSASIAWLPASSGWVRRERQKVRQSGQNLINPPWTFVASC